MLDKKIIKYSIILLIPLFLIGFGLSGCIKVYPEGQREAAMEEQPMEEHFEEPPPEEHFEEPPPEEPPPEEHFEEPPPEEHPEEHPPEEHPPEEPQQQQQEPSKISEKEAKERCFHAAQYEIEKNSIYSNVIFNTTYDDKYVNKVTGRDYCYECTIEFHATDTNVKKEGLFIWTFVVSYDQNSDSCNVETGAKQFEGFGKTKTVN